MYSLVQNGLDNPADRCCPMKVVIQSLAESLHFEDIIDVVAIAFYLLLLHVGICDIFFLLHCYLLLELEKLVFELILVVVHVIILGEHLVHHIALHLQIHHFISQIIDFI